MESASEVDSMVKKILVAVRNSERMGFMAEDPAATSTTNSTVTDKANPINLSPGAVRFPVKAVAIGNHVTAFPNILEELIITNRPDNTILIPTVPVRDMPLFLKNSIRGRARSFTSYVGLSITEVSLVWVNEGSRHGKEPIVAFYVQVSAAAKIRKTLGMPAECHKDKPKVKYFCPTSHDENKRRILIVCEPGMDAVEKLKKRLDGLSRNTNVTTFPEHPKLPLLEMVSKEKALEVLTLTFVPAAGKDEDDAS